MERTKNTNKDDLKKASLSFCGKVIAEVGRLGFRVSRVVGITEISAIVAAAGVLVGVIYYTLDIRQQNKVRQTDLTMRLYTSWVSEELTKPWLKVWNLEFTDYDDFKKKYGDFLSDNPENAALLSVLNSFTTMGILVQKRLVDAELMDHLPVGMTWNKVRPIVEGLRKETHDPSWYQEFEYLYNEMKKYEQKVQQSKDSVSAQTA